MPTRVLELIEGPDQSLIRLQETANGIAEAYPTLSYCWGGQQITTTTSNFELHKKTIGLENLPQVSVDRFSMHYPR